jgi:hypothetical protein
MIILAIAPFMMLDFSVSDGGALSDGDTAQWAWGVPKSGPVGSESVWGTNLGGNYLNDTVDWLEIALPDLSKVTQPLLEMTHWYAINPTDNGTLQVFDDGVWYTVEPVYGYPDKTGFIWSSLGWVTDYVDLSGFVAAESFRLVLTADVNTANEGWYVSDIKLYDGEVAPPLIQPITVPIDTQEYESDYLLEILVSDISIIKDVSVTYSVNGGTWQSTLASDQGSDLWAVMIPAQEPGSTIAWYVVASDDNSMSRYPETGEEEFRVYLASPTGLTVPEGRLVSSTLALSWDAPVSPHIASSYTVYQGEELLATDVLEETALLDVLSTIPTEFTVSANYDWGEGDLSDTLAVDLEIPVVTTVSPSEIYVGSSTYVDIYGESLYLTQQSAVVESIPGVNVDQIQVIDVNHIRILISIDEETAVGSCVLTVWGEYGATIREDALTLLPASEAPSVVSVSPASIRQGEDTVILLTTNASLGAKIMFTLPEGLSLENSSVTSTQSAELTISVSAVAAVGEYLLIMDDGERLWPFTIEVLEKIYLQEGGCNTAPEVKYWTWLLVWPLLLLPLRRRRVC